MHVIGARQPDELAYHYICHVVLDIVDGTLARTQKRNVAERVARLASGKVAAAVD